MIVSPRPRPGSTSLRRFRSGCRALSGEQLKSGTKGSLDSFRGASRSPAQPRRGDLFFSRGAAADGSQGWSERSERNPWNGSSRCTEPRWGGSTHLDPSTLSPRRGLSGMVSQISRVADPPGHHLLPLRGSGRRDAILLASQSTDYPQMRCLPNTCCRWAVGSRHLRCRLHGGVALRSDASRLGRHRP
jgi:hypothetical protein